MSKKLIEGLAFLKIELSPKQVSQIEQMLEQLLHWNSRHNLTSHKKIDDFIVYHVLDSLAAVKYFQAYHHILDIGTGAGFPGIPLAIVYPEKEFHLLDSNGKKIAYLRHLISHIGLENVKLHHSRVQDFKSDQIDLITSRALADPLQIVKMTSHLINRSGMVLYCGQRDRNTEGYKSIELEVPFSEKQHFVLVAQE